MKRIEWIDVAKGIGIFLVVLGHTPVPESLEKWIFSFHMPLFFFLSGLLFKPTKYNHFKEFTISKSKSLLLPYSAFSLISYACWIVRGTAGVSPYIPALGIIYSNGFDPWMVHNRALWFLTCLFVVDISFYLIRRVVTKPRYIGLLLFFFGAVGYLDSIYMPFRLPWGIDVALTAVVFYGSGYLMSQSNFTIRSAHTRAFLFIAFFGLNLALFPLSENKVDMNYNTYGNFSLFYITAFSGIFSILLLSQLISAVNLKAISFIGRNSLVMLALHSLVLGVVAKTMIIFLEIEFTDSLLWCMVLSVATTLTIAPLIYLVNNHFSFLIGKFAKKIVCIQQETTPP